MSQNKITACVDNAIRALDQLRLSKTEIARIMGLTHSAISFHMANRRKTPLLGAETAASVDILARAHAMAARRLAEDEQFVADCVKSATGSKNFLPKA